MSSRKNSTELMSQYPHKGIPLSKKKKKKNPHKGEKFLDTFHRIAHGMEIFTKAEE